MAPVRAVDGLAQRDGLEHHRHEADVDRLLVVEGRATEALGGIGLDLLGLLEQALDRLRQLLPALGVERHREADECGIGVVEAAGRRRCAGVVVDHLQGGADGGLLGDRRGLLPGLVADLRPRARLVVVLDRAADARLVDELDQPELVQRADVVGDGAERPLEHLRELDRTGRALLEDGEDAHPQRVAHGLDVARVVDARDRSHGSRRVGRGSALKAGGANLIRAVGHT